jgi:RNA polymerase sigma factor (sigma-70 family)
MPSLNQEADLVARLRTRENKALSDFYNEYGGLMYLAIHRVIKNEEAASDILQESMVKCLYTIDSYNPASNGRLRVWASNISRNLAIDYLRGRQTTKETQPAPVTAGPTHLNTRMKDQNGQRYEIYWTTEAAKHVLDNYIKDLGGGVHQDIDHTLVAKLLKTARYVVAFPDDPRPLYHVCLTGYRGKVYETYVYLVPELDHRPPRCVIVSSYVNNKQHYRDLFNN